MHHSIVPDSEGELDQSDDSVRSVVKLLERPTSTFAIAVAALALAGWAAYCEWPHIGQYMQVLAVGLGLFYGYLNTRASYLNKETVDRWYELSKFRFEHPEYFDSQKNLHYKKEFKGTDLVKYDAAARRSIALVDDMYHFYLKDDKKSVNSGHYRGSVPLWVGTHRAWFEDNTSAYAPGFVQWINDELRKC